MSTHKEPAIKSYFFGKGYQDLGDVIIESWDSNLNSAKNFFSRIDTSGDWWITLAFIVFWGGAGISVVVFGTIVFALISILHVALLSIFFGIIYICFTIVWILERIFMFFKSFFSACPYCHEKNPLPEYLCDKCGEGHRHLVPNSYGILHHTCQCGQKLPCTFFLNRGRLQARCQSCEELLLREHIESRRVFFPIMGGPHAGKTAFMFAVVRKLIDEHSAQYGFDTEFIDTTTEADYNQAIDQLQKGFVPSKTVANIPKAFNLALKRDNKTKWVTYIYDPAGEAYESTDDLAVHRFNGYLSGMVLIVDPFSMDAVKRQYASELARCSEVNPSQLNVIEALERIIISMEESFGLSKTGKIKKPLAVVISKVDAFGLERIIGEPAVDDAMSKSNNKDRAEVRNTLIRNQLSDWEEDGLLQQLDTRFKQVRFFTCSALGRIPDSSGMDLVPNHVFEPICWLLSNVSATDFDMNKVKLN